MSGDDRVLSQDEIDALLPKNAAKLKPKSPAATATLDAPKLPEPAPELKATLPATPKPEPVIDIEPLSFPVTAAHHNDNTEKIENIEKSLNTLIQQVTKMSKSLEKIDKLEERVGDISESVQSAFNVLSDFDKRIKKIQKNLKELSHEKPKKQPVENQSKKPEPKQMMVYRVKCTVSDPSQKGDNQNNSTQSWRDSQGRLHGVNSPRPGTSQWLRQQEDFNKYPHLTSFF